MSEYSAWLKCEVCKKETCHIYVDGEWQCLICQRKSEYGEALTDVAKAAERLLRRREV